MPDTCPTLRRDGDQIVILDQTRLPWRETFVHLDSLDAAAAAIRDMQVRGAPLIGAVAAYGVALAMREDPAKLEEILEALNETRPTAINLRWALDRQRAKLHNLPLEARAAEAYAEAAFLNGRPEQALIQLENLKKRGDLDYVTRSRVDARIATITPQVLELRRQGIQDPDMQRR